MEKFSDSFNEIAEDDDAGVRLDVFIAANAEDTSRSFIKKCIKEGLVHVNNQVCTRPGRTLSSGDQVKASFPAAPATTLESENISLDIVYQDEHVIVINKPTGMVVHPAPGHYKGTLVHGLLYHFPDMRDTGDEPLRPGIVHRLDRDTSGLLVVARSPEAFAGLGEQVREHSFDRRYLALVRGEFKEDAGKIDAPIRRSLTDRKRMSVTGTRGRDAITRFTVLERLGKFTLLSVELETGRTHQIRVHLKFTGHPVIGDPVYGVTEYTPMKLPEPVCCALRNLKGQALHAEQLGFIHPMSGKHLMFHAPLPEDFLTALNMLRSTYAIRDQSPDPSVE